MASQAFIPDDDITGQQAQPNGTAKKPIINSSVPHGGDAFPSNVPLVIHAKAVSIGDGYIELDRDAADANVSQVVFPPEIEGVASVSRISDQLRNSLSLADRNPRDKRLRRRVSWDYLVYVRRTHARTHHPNFSFVARAGHWM